MASIVSLFCVYTLAGHQYPCNKSLEAFFIETKVTSTADLVQRYYSREASKVVDRVDKQVLYIGLPIYAILIQRSIKFSFAANPIASNVTLTGTTSGGIIALSWRIP